MREHGAFSDHEILNALLYVAEQGCK